MHELLHERLFGWTPVRNFLHCRIMAFLLFFGLELMAWWPLAIFMPELEVRSTASGSLVFYWRIALPGPVPPTGAAGRLTRPLRAA